MRHTIYLCNLEIKETFRARWYQIYIAVVAVLISVFFYFGLGESRALGFTGLGRLLLSVIQMCIVILPIFALMTTVRTLVSDRESGVWEYNLSLPMKLSSFYWGRSLGRFLSLFIPLILGLAGAGLLSLIQGYPVPWQVILFYSIYVAANLLCFTGIAVLISVLSKNQEMALGLGFILWLIAEFLVDALLLGIMVKLRISSELILGVAFLNPLQVFRMAAISLFDPELTVLGPIAYTVIDKIGLNFLLNWAAIWPIVIGISMAFLGYLAFKKRDLL